jgi:hypothetical protein
MLRVLLTVLAVLPFGASAAGKPLNQIAIHYKYGDGDFPGVIQDIEAFTQTHKTYARTDSVFIAKHLAVVYTANPDTREKGKYYMYRMLELIPSAELVDMYVSDEIEKIFARVKLEFEAKHKEKAFAEAEAKRVPLWKNPWVWGGTAAVAAGAITAAIVLHEDDKPRPEYVVP